MTKTDHRTGTWAHQIADTPGFSATKIRDGWKVANTNTSTSMKLPRSVDANGCSESNLRSRLRSRIGWTVELYEQEQARRRQERLREDQHRAQQALRAAEEKMTDRHTPTPVSSDDFDTSAPGFDIDKILAQPPLIGPGGMSTRYELITPDTALDLIVATPEEPDEDGRRLQRKQGRDRVMILTEALRRGEYVTTHQGIAINRKGQVVDGLHRLKSALEAEESLLILVTRDLPEEAMPVIDIGKPRSAGDWFTMAGEKNSAYLAALLKVIYLWDNVPDQTKWDRYPALTKVQLQQVIDGIDAERAKDPDLPDPREAIRQGTKLRKLRGGARINQTAAAAAWYFIRDANPLPASMDTYDPVDAFFYRLWSGSNLPEGDPILALRNWLDPEAIKRRRSSDSSKKRPAQLLHLYLLIKAWESWSKGEKKAGVAYAANFVIPEPVVYAEVH